MIHLWALAVPLAIAVLLAARAITVIRRRALARQIRPIETRKALMTASPPRLCFLDLETTGLDPDRHEIWEIGVIARGHFADDREFRWMLPTDLAKADPNSLRIGRYYERTAGLAKPRGIGYATNLADPQAPKRGSDPHAVALKLAELLDGSHMVGAVPSFDAAFLKRFLPAHGQAFTAHYHLIDVEAMAVGWAHGVFRHAADQLAAQGLPHDVVDQGPTLVTKLPWNSNMLSRGLRIDPDAYERHTALGDARWVRDQYDAITRPPARDDDG